MEKPPSSLRTGFGGANAKGIDKNSPLGKRLISLVFVLVKRAATTAALYCTHAKRSLVTPQDVGMAMRYHAMTFLAEHGFEELEKDVQDMEALVSQFVQEEATSSDVVDAFVDGAYDEDSDDEETADETDETEDIDDAEEEEDVMDHICVCETCAGIRSVDWETWQPEDPAEQFLKKHIDEVFTF